MIASFLCRTDLSWKTWWDCYQSQHTNYDSDYSVTCSITTEVKSFTGFFQRICQNFKTRKQEILIFNCFRSSSVSAFCEVGVLKTSAKFLGKHVLSLFKKVIDHLAWNFKFKTASRIFFIFFNEFCKNFKNTFLQDSSRRLLLIFRKPDIQTFNSKQICSLDQYCPHAIFDE